MKVEIEMTGSELVLLYLATGNEDAGRIVLTAAKEYAHLHPPQRKKRGRPSGRPNMRKELVSMRGEVA
jgi:hypothetical protein